MHTTRSWNNLHEKSKEWKANYLKKFGAIKPKGVNRIAKIG